MPTWLNVAEKPSVAKEVAAVLSGGKSRATPSLSRFNPVFEFTYEGVNMVMTSVAGHLMEDEFPPQAKNWNAFPFLELFNIRINKTVKQELLPLKKNIEKLAKRADTLVLWLDCDREGENICFEVMQIALAENSRLNVKRAHFSALTARDLHQAMRTLTAPNKRLSDAVEARQEMDLRIGAAFTRFQSVKLRDAFDNLPKVLSFGPCQFPTLGFVVRRYWEQKGFTPEDYFTLYMRHDASKFSCKRGSIYDQMAATLLYEDMMEAAAEEGNTAKVLQVNQRPSHKRAPVPLATVVLQKLASTHLRITSEKCMSLAESLYQEGLISYPRTETDSYSYKDEELLQLVRTQSDNRDVSSFVEAMLSDTQNRFRRPGKGGHDDKAHPPIHPTKAWNASNDDDKGKLYNLIVRHFLACLSPDAVAATTFVVVEFGGELFTTSGTTVVSKGWMEIFTYERWNSSLIPNYQQGTTFTPDEVQLEKHRTAPPPHLTETNLISLMDSNGIGTDATIAQHIKTVLDREYVRREGQCLVPTTLGIALASAYEVLGLASLLQPQLRAQMEMAMSDIANGTATKEQVVAAAVRLYTEIFERLASMTQKFKVELANHLTMREGGAAGGGGTANFSATTTVKARFCPCGKCGTSMKLLKCADGSNHETWFVHCPKCDTHYRVPNGFLNDLEPVEPLQRCVLCSFPALRVTNKEKRSSYTVCSYCFSNPPNLPDMEVTGEFRCFQCTADCPLASGLESLSITKCFACESNDLRLRTSNHGNAYLACKGYPDCTLTVSLPAATSIRPVPSQRCPTCHSVMLTFDFRNVQPVPGMEVVETICVVCNGRVKDYLSCKGGRASTFTSNYYGNNNSNNNHNNNAAYSLPSGPRLTGRDASGNEVVMCNCGQPAKLLVSKKDQSKGRQFWTCNGRKCPFFKWAD